MVLPELWTTGAFAYEEFAARAEPLEGPTHEAMAKAASDAGVWLHAGSIPERAASEDGSGSEAPSTTPPSSTPPPVNSSPPTGRSTASASTRARPY